MPGRGLNNMSGGVVSLGGVQGRRRKKKKKRKKKSVGQGWKE